ncbi:PEGA domain-containing protein [Deinococcus aquaticus]|uniref:PEGA domain-containing protein n=1 Tax=Deinococcus aquaticus TaxID=328692 RepID=UPI0036144A2F
MRVCARAAAGATGRAAAPAGHAGHAPVQPVTGEQGLYRQPGPGTLLVSSDRAAFVTSVVLPQGGRAAVLPAAPVMPGQAQVTALPGTLGFTQVFTVASLEPLNLGGAAGARSVGEISRAVEATAASLPRGAYTVATTTYRVEQFGSLSVRASQPGAEVRVNDRPVGTAPVVVTDLPQGQVTVSVSLGGYQTFTQRVIVRPETTSEVSAALRRVTGILSVRSDVPAAVLIEERRRVTRRWT